MGRGLFLLVAGRLHMKLRKCAFRIRSRSRTRTFSPEFTLCNLPPPPPPPAPVPRRRLPAALLLVLVGPVLAVVLTVAEHALGDAPAPGEALEAPPLLAAAVGRPTGADVGGSLYMCGWGEFAIFLHKYICSLTNCLHLCLRSSFHFKKEKEKEKKFGWAKCRA